MEERLTFDENNTVVEGTRRKNQYKKKYITWATIFILVVVSIVLAITLMNRGTKSHENVTSTYVTVHTDCGRVKGRMSKSPKLNGSLSYEFVNIPYAQPPVNELRWKRTVPKSASMSNCWKGEYPAHITTKKQCTQPHLNPFTGEQNLNETVGEEDCLYLTVRSPNISAKLPVVVWIHGGGLYIGNNQMPGYSPDVELATSLNIVTVSINYRLGFFGFISLEELWSTETGKESYGNYGFLDQITALQWVKRNIASFGGDPDSITILGQSAGGTSVLVLMASPLTVGLFHRGIAQSPISPRVGYKDWNKKSRDWIFKTTQCDLPVESDRRQCLYNLPPEAVSSLTVQALTLLPKPLLPFPNETFDGFAMLDPIVLPTSPYDMKSSPFTLTTPRPMILSTMAQETSLPPGAGYADTEWQTMRNDVKHSLDRFNMSLADTVFRLYANQTSALNRTLPPQLIYETISTDIRWTCAANRVSQSFSESSSYKVYRIYIKHQPKNPVTYRFAFHGWDSLAFFDSTGKLSPHDKALKMNLRALLKTFAYNGTLDSKWQAYPKTSAEFANRQPWTRFIDGPPQSEHCSFWESNGFSKFSL